MCHRSEYHETYFATFSCDITMYKYYIHGNSQLYNQWKQKPENSHYDSNRFTKVIITKGYHECEFNGPQPNISTNEWVAVRLATETYIGQYLPTPTRKWRTSAVKWKSSFYCRYIWIIRSLFVKIVQFIWKLLSYLMKSTQLSGLHAKKKTEEKYTF